MKYSLLILLFLTSHIFSDSLSDFLILSEGEQELYERCSFQDLAKAGRAFKQYGDWRNGVQFLKAALKQKPDDWSINWDLGDLYLLQGDFKLGMLGFKHRWMHDSKYKNRLWQGEALLGKAILVHCQWGLGDTFMYIRYLKLLKKMGAYVICSCQKSLKKILSYCDYIDQLTLIDDISFDYQVPITYLPEIFNTTIDTVPVFESYIHVEQKFVDFWEPFFDKKKINIGICWQGALRDDPQTAWRSINLKELEPIFRIPNTVIYSLQKGDGIEQVDSLNSDLFLFQFDSKFDTTNGSFVDTAAVIKNLDLIITIDTSIAHLAGALGANVWVMLPYANEWRFFLNVDYSPWYKKMKLFRQSTLADWHAVINKIVFELSNFRKN